MCSKRRSAHKRKPRTSSTVSNTRKHIWEIPPSLHCSIIGTCLALSDLTAIARRRGLRFPLGATEYEIHGAFVQIVETENATARLVDKRLERKYRRVVAKIRMANSEEALLEAWEAAWKNNEIPGAYWAVLSHPLLNLDIRHRVFGDVHMLSHMLGASRRTDLHRVQQQDAQLAALQEKLALVKKIYRKRVKARDDVIVEMQAELGVLKRAERQLALARATVHELKQQSGVAALETRVTALEASLRKEATRALLAEESLTELKKVAAREAVMTAKAFERIHFLTEENAALEQELRSTLSCSMENPACENIIENNGVNLCGRKIMYVGGRSGLVQYYRALVERRGGVFLYHDGGIEHSMELLKNALNGADAVICPVDCVSHKACLSVKQACKHMAKPFIPLRSAGLSALACGMQEIA